MKVSELQNIIDHLPKDSDPDIVIGETWLPERLVNTNLDGDMLFLEFDNAPEDNQGDEEGRGFVEHEIAMIREKLEQVLDDTSDTRTKADALLAIFLMGHELSSSEVIEVLESTELESTESESTELESAESEMTELEATQHETTEPEIAEHKTTESDIAELEEPKLETTMHQTDKLETSIPQTEKLETKQHHDD
ncbi:VC1380 family protein [Vibrio tasmaniensis]|uniref:hypothetical protein n=1 Tax=Vibrio tasmaniensis TaxID=212663 RepID=UPI001118EE89|nr:hypothetical protein [Vibrio tasmaniensis]